MRKVIGAKRLADGREIKLHENDGIRKLCDCSRRDWWKPCPHATHFSYKYGGKHYRISMDRYLDRRITSKTEALEEAEKVRVAIRGGTFQKKGTRLCQHLRVGSPSLSWLTSTLSAPFASSTRTARRAMSYVRTVLLRTVLPGLDGVGRAVGDWPLGSVMADDVERFKEVRHAEHAAVKAKWHSESLQRVEAGLGELRDKGTLRPRQRSRLAKLEGKQAELAARQPSSGRVSVNRCLEMLRAMYNWAILKGYANRTPFKVRHQDGAVTAVKLFRESRRRRRLEQGEEPKLLAACGPHLGALVEAALETCCRSGELLSMQFRQIEWERGEIFLPAAKTKSKKDRGCLSRPGCGRC